MLRQTFLFLSRHRGLRRWFETSRRAGPLTSRFIAGETLDDVLRVARRLHGERLLTTIDHLGENVTTEAEALASRQAMERALDAIEASSLPATISIKLTQFGLDLSDALCLQNVSVLARRAAAIGSRVEIDMEASQYVDRTLAVVEKLHAEFHCIRCVLQAYLYRTLEDARRMNSLGVPIRLCKGAYKEPLAIAWPEKSKVDESYIALSRLLLDEGAYPAFATHDPRMIDNVLRHAARTGRGAASFEFQMLYGIRRDLQQQLAGQGFRVRLYVPYGDAWYPYFMRRLAERPANVFFIARNLLRA
jgi:proline dehydrogenase